MSENAPKDGSVAGGDQPLDARVIDAVAACDPGARRYWLEALLGTEASDAVDSLAREGTLEIRDGWVLLTSESSNGAGDEALHRALAAAIAASSFREHEAWLHEARQLAAAGDAAAAAACCRRTLSRSNMLPGRDTLAVQVLDTIEQAGWDELKPEEEELRAHLCRAIGDLRTRALWSALHDRFAAAGDVEGAARAACYAAFGANDEASDALLRSVARSDGGWPRYALLTAANLDGEEAWRAAQPEIQATLDFARATGDRLLELLALEQVAGTEPGPHSVAAIDAACSIDAPDIVASLRVRQQRAEIRQELLDARAHVAAAEDCVAFVTSRGIDSMRARALAELAFALRTTGDCARAAEVALEARMAAIDSDPYGELLAWHAHDLSRASMGMPLDPDEQYEPVGNGRMWFGTDAQLVDAIRFAVRGELDAAGSALAGVDETYQPVLGAEAALEIARRARIAGDLPLVETSCQRCLEWCEGRSTPLANAHRLEAQWLLSSSDGAERDRPSRRWALGGRELDALRSAIVEHRVAPGDDVELLARAMRRGCVWDIEAMRPDSASATHHDGAVDLAGTPLDVLSPDQQARLVAASRRRTVAKGRDVLGADAAPELLVVTSGIVRLVREGALGREITTCVLRAPALIGAESLLGAAGPELDERAVASGEVHCIVLPTIAVRELVEADHTFASAIAMDMARRVADVGAMAEDLAFFGLERRLARLLLRLDAQHGHPRLDGSRIINHAFTHEELASMLGVVRKTLTTALGVLRDRGLLTMDGRRIVLLDIEGIAQLAGSDDSD